MGRVRSRDIRLHHVGWVVGDLTGARSVFDALGFGSATGPEPDPIQKVNASFVEAASGERVYVELLTPLAEDSPITGHLKRGGGLHHLCFEVGNIEAETCRLKKMGYRLVREAVECVGFDRSFKRPGNRSARIAFFLVPGKLLIELVER